MKANVISLTDKVLAQYNDNGVRPYLDAFNLDCSVRNLTPKTIDVYFERLGCLLVRIRGQGVSFTGITRQVIQEYIMCLKGQVSDETINGRIRAYRRFFNFLVSEGLWERDNRRLKMRLKKAKLRQSATIEDIDYRHPRGLHKSLMLSLAGCQWIQKHHNCIITGPTGAGKTYLACALGQKACREGYSVLYRRLPRLFQELSLAKGDGRYIRLLAAFERTELVILDDWGMASLNDEQRRDLFEIPEDRYDRRSTLIAAQLPIKHWHQIIGDPTLADAILDRLIHNAHKLNLKGESMRKKQKSLTNTEKGNT